MKKILISLMLISALVTGCNNDLETEGLSRTTYFPEFVLEGEDFYVIPETETFNEPGIEVLEQGAPIQFTSRFTGRYTGYSGSTIGAAADEYTLSYRAVNRDGFAATTGRVIAKVNTGDFVTSIAGAYYATSVRVGGETYEDVLVLVREVEPGVFEVTDALGGFYSDGRALGDDYLVHGLEITVNDLSVGDFSYEEDVVRGDGTGLQVSELDIDPATKTITFRTTTDEFANGDWTITLTQIQP